MQSLHISFPRTAALLAVAMVAVGGVPLPTRCSEAITAADALESPRRAAILTDRIVELRLEASYARAAAVAETLAALTEADRASRPFEVEDAWRLVEALRGMASLPPEARRELAEADSLRRAIVPLWNDGRTAEAKAAVEREIEIRRSHLGARHRDLATALNDLAIFHKAVGDDTGAEKAYREALGIRREVLGDEHPDIASSLWGLGGVLRRRGDLPGAEQLFREALTMQRSVFGEDDIDIATSLNDLALVLRGRGDYENAESAALEALAIQKRLLGEEHRHVATSLFNLGYLYQTKSDFEQAERYYRKSLEMRRSLFGERHLAVASSLNGLALLFHVKGDYGSAEPLYRESLEMRKALYGGPHPNTAISLSNLGSLLHSKGDYAGAEELIREALAIQTELRGDDHPQTVRTLNNLALMIQEQGDYAAAEPLFRRVVAIERATLGGSSIELAKSLSNLGLLLQAQGNYAEAEPLYREGLGIARELFGQEHPMIATELNNLAFLLHARGDLTGAEPLCREALAMRRKLLGVDHPETAQSTNNLALLRQDQDDLAEAEALSREALVAWTRIWGDEHPDVATGLNNLAGVLEARYEIAAAESMYRRALAVRRSVFGEGHPDVVQSLANLGHLLQCVGDAEQAQELFAEAARAYDAARVRAGVGLSRTAFQRTPYTALAGVRLALGRKDEAWTAAERANARSLAEVLIAAGERRLTPSEAAREDSLRRSLGRLEAELLAYRETGRSDTTSESIERTDAARNALLATEAAWSAFQQAVAAAHPVTEGQSFELDRVQASMEENTAIIGWLDVGFGKAGPDGGPRPRESWCYAIRRSGPVSWARVPASPARSDGPRAQVLRFREALADPDAPGTAVDRDARRLWRERLEPLLGALEGAERLVVVPSGAMLGVPVEVLADSDGIPLGERYAVSYAPSATVRTWLAERARGRRDAGTEDLMLLVGDPPYNDAHLAAMDVGEGVALAATSEAPSDDLLRNAVAGNRDALEALPRLPGTRQEVASIAGLSGGASLLVGPDASEQKLAELAGSGDLGAFRTLHIATHALIDDERPERSALVLSQVDLPDACEAAMSGTRIYDGLVTAQEILREWDLTADLVTLSACETGLGREVAGEGYVGFAHAFLQAGARSLLVSLWKVEDQATSLLMRRFYENRLGGHDDARGGASAEPMPKDEALREAKAWLRSYTDEHGRRPFGHPYYWSGFVLIGDPS